MEENKELEQDVKDLLMISDNFAPVYRCNYCDRYSRVGYVCIHCGEESSE